MEATKTSHETKWLTVRSITYYASPIHVNTLRSRQNCRHFPDDILKCIFLNEYVWISIKISLKFVLKGPNNNIAALVQIMAWRRPGDKPLSETMLSSLLTHICVTRPQWVKTRTGSGKMIKSDWYITWTAFISRRFDIRCSNIEHHWHYFVMDSWPYIACNSTSKPPS